MIPGTAAEFCHAVPAGLSRGPQVIAPPLQCSVADTPSSNWASLAEGLWTLAVSTIQTPENGRLHLPRSLGAEARAQKHHQRAYLRFRQLHAKGRHGPAKRTPRGTDAIPDHLPEVIGHWCVNRGLECQWHGRPIVAMALRTARLEHLGALADFLWNRRRFWMPPLELES